MVNFDLHQYLSSKFVYSSVLYFIFMGMKYLLDSRRTKRSFYWEFNFLKTQIDFLGCNTLQIYNLGGIEMFCYNEVKTVILLAGQVYSLTMQLKKVTWYWMWHQTGLILLCHKFKTRSIAAAVFLQLFNNQLSVGIY